MMSAITFDTLQFAKVLQRTGLTSEQAEAFATVQRETLSQLAEEYLSTQTQLADVQAEVKFTKESYATKAELKEVRTTHEHLATKADIADLRAAQENFATKIDLAQVEAKIRTEMAEMRAESKSDLAEIRTEMRFLKWTQGIVITGIMAILVSIFLKLFF